MRQVMLTGTAVLVLAAAIGCGGGSGPTSPSGGSGGGGTGGGGTGGGGGDTGTTATITIGSNGAVSPREVTIRQGGRVTFVNNHTRNHDMSSDPHPSHEDCPALDQVGFLTPGQSRTSGNLTVARRCGFHDHEDPGNLGLRGTVIVQP